MYLLLKKYSYDYFEGHERYILGLCDSEEEFYDVVKRDIEDFNHRYNYEMSFDKLEIQTLASSYGEIFYAIQKPTVKYFIEEYEEKFELDYVEYFAIPLEENKRINMRMAFSNYRNNTVCYF
jgi:hypothetical protein